MRDPLDLCIRRSSFSHARSRITRSEPSNSAKSVETNSFNTNNSPCQYPLPAADNDFESLLHAFQLDLAENASAGWLKDAISLKRLELHQLSKPLQRSCSCSGRIEASPSHPGGHVRKPLSFYTDRPITSRSSTLPGPVSKSHSRQLSDQEILEFSLHKRIGGSAREKKKYSSHEKHALEYQIGEPDPASKLKNDNAEAAVLPSLGSAQKATRTWISSVSFRALTRKRCLEDEDEEVSITLYFKKPRGRTNKLKRLDGYQSTVKSIGIVKSDPTLNLSPSEFQASKWLGIEQSVFQFVPPRPTNSRHATTETSIYLRLSEEQLRVKLEPSSSNLESACPIRDPNGRSHPQANPTPFVSALDEFNKVIPGCNAMQRFQNNRNWCLANKKDGSRCQWRMPLATRCEVSQLLNEVRELNISINVQECFDKLVALTMVAVCQHQQDSVKGKLNLILQGNRLRSSVQASPSTPGLQSERSHAPERSGLSSMMEKEREIDVAQVERQIKTSPTSSGFKVTYWLRKPVSGALQYLPDHRPYHAPEPRPRSVRDWVIEQAKEPLFTSKSRTNRGFQGLDECKDGYIYVYWNRASFGLVKIGCTTLDVDSRLREWEELCKHPAQELYRSPFRIKNVARVEKLLHTEFREHRVYEPWCRGCDGKHIEWFRGMDLGLVVKRIEAWTEWILKEPYQEKYGRWKLKDNLESVLPQDYSPMLSKVTNSPKKRNPPTVEKKSSRYNLRRRRVAGSSPNSSSPTRS